MTDFGRDTWCLDSRTTGRYATGLQVPALRLYRRFITPRGTLRGGEQERNFGLDLAEMVGSATTVELKASLPQRIKNEAKKDPEINSVAVAVEASTENKQDTWKITITAETDDGPFDLVLGVDAATVELLGINT